MAEQVGRPPAQVALAWLSAQPGVSSVLVGASNTSQLQDNLASLDVQLSGEQLQVLSQASADPAHPEGVFSEGLKRLVFGGTSVLDWR